MQNVRFTPRLWPTVGTLCGLALFVHLGLWQQGKAERLSADIAQRTERAVHGAYRLTSALVDGEQIQDAPVTVRGRYLTDRQFFVDNRQENGVPGVHVVTPLQIENSTTLVLVNRGWIAWGQGRSALPKVTTPEGDVEVSGMAAIPSRKKFFLMPDHGDAMPHLWSRLDLERFTAESKTPVQPVVVLQSKADASDGLVRNWQPPENRVGMHQSYAYQWFGMAIALMIFYVVASLQREKQNV